MYPFASLGSDKNGILFSRQKKVEKKEFAPIVVGGPYTLEEISKHNKRDDVWLIVEDKVYDVSSFVDSHTGGDAILRNAGGDSTMGFKGPQHPEYVLSELKDYYIGDVKK